MIESMCSGNAVLGVPKLPRAKVVRFHVPVVPGRSRELSDDRAPPATLMSRPHKTLLR